ncbi:MAG: OmpA family protein [Deltaproteobacteria bacterium]|nr:OmpA family protein [Deltaproteobacteria bacterium]
MYRKALFALGVYLLALAPSQATAQSFFVQGDRLFDVQLFQPGIAPGDFLNVRGSESAGHMQLLLSAYLSYMRNPLKAELLDDVDRAVVNNQVGLEIAGALSLWNRLMFGVAIPVSISQTCVEAASDVCRGRDVSHLDAQNFEGGGFGDIRLTVRGTIIQRRQADRGFGLGAGVRVSLPTADATAFVGEANRKDIKDPSSSKTFNPTVTPYVAADYVIGQLRFGGNVGYLLRRDRKFANITIADQLLYGAAAGYRIRPWIEALAEVDGRLTVSDAGGNSPHEARVAARFYKGDFRFDIGAGTGITGNYGAPDLRVFGGVAYAKGFVLDTDGDGVPDSDDKCPEQAEDKDGFQDADGCPDLDNDGDGIPDSLDKCPLQAAVTADGCPSADNDHDGVPDDRDKCPGEPEDRDGFQDEDGCPDPDNDNDGIADKEDKCPNEPEVFNKVDDEDGCPDTAVATPTAPTITPTRIDIKERIGFALGKTALTDASKKVLDTVAELINKTPSIKLIRVEGHTDNRGSAAKNLKLSQQRASAVRRYLIGKGVAAGRLQAVGYGDKRPIASNDTKEGRRDNRRVEFIIVQRTK